VGEFSPSGWLFSFLGFTKVANILGHSLRINFGKKWIGSHFGRLFHKLIWSPWSVREGSHVRICQEAVEETLIKNCRHFSVWFGFIALVWIYTSFFLSVYFLCLLCIFLFVRKGHYLHVYIVKLSFLYHAYCFRALLLCKNVDDWKIIFSCFENAIA
jgi:hypothetical protein